MKSSHTQGMCFISEHTYYVSIIFHMKHFIKG